MRGKIFALIAALSLVSTAASPSNLVTQGLLDEKTRIVVVAGIGSDQKLELYSYQKGGIFTITVTLIDDDTANGTCRETVQANMKDGPGLKVVVIQMGEGNESIVINNGEDEVPLDSACFNNETKRVVFEVRVPNSASMANQIPVVPNSAPLGFSNVGIVGSTVVNSDGTTAASDGASLVMERSFSVGGVGENETVEFYLGRGSSRENHQAPKRAVGDTVVFTYVVTNTGDATCTQLHEKTLLEAKISGRPILVTTVSKGFSFVSIDGEEEVLLNDCFNENSPSQRVAVQVAVQGGDRRFKLPNNNSPYPTTVPAPYPLVGSIVVVGPNGETRATTGMGRVFPRIEIEQGPF